MHCTVMAKEAMICGAVKSLVSQFFFIGIRPVILLGFVHFPRFYTARRNWNLFRGTKVLFAVVVPWH